VAEPPHAALKLRDAITVEDRALRAPFTWSCPSGSRAHVHTRRSQTVESGGSEPTTREPLGGLGSSDAGTGAACEDGLGAGRWKCVAQTVKGPGGAGPRRKAERRQRLAGEPVRPSAYT